MESRHISGLSAALIKNGKLAWTGNYGLSQRTSEEPVTENTSFMLASISKTFVCTAIMQLYEDGLFDLDDAINDYLPFEIHSPSYPDSAITFRHLLTHTSGLRDNWSILYDFYTYGEDSPIALSDFMQQYFEAGGDHYSASGNFYTYAPGETYNYCNEAIALCAYLVELIADEPFPAYCNENIFEPLCMENTAWLLSELDTTSIAHPYSYSDGEYHDEGLYCYPDYPDGQLRTTAVSLAKFLWMNMQYGAFGSEQILDSTTVALIRSSQIPTIDPLQGLIWYAYTDETGMWWGHAGDDIGVTTNMYFNEEKQLGLIVLTNGDPNHDNIWYEILSMADSLNTDFAPVMACDIESPLLLGSQKNKTLHIFPNPVSEILHIQCDDIIEEICLSDICGRQYDVTLNGTSISIVQLPAGLYTLQVRTPEGIFTSSFVKL